MRIYLKERLKGESKLIKKPSVANSQILSYWEGDIRRFNDDFISVIANVSNFQFLSSEVFWITKIQNFNAEYLSQNIYNCDNAYKSYNTHCVV